MTTLDSFRDEEYTGSNRCWPCTIVNLALLAAAVLYVRVRGRPLASAAVATLGVGVIYLRGYLVPFTPAFAPRLVAASPLPDDLFHDADVADEDPASLATDVALDGEVVFERLLEVGVVEPDGEMIVLSDDVEGAWTEEMDELARLSPATLGARISDSISAVDEAEALVSDGSEWIVLGGDSAQTVAYPVAVAELAAYRTLGDYLEDEQLRLAAAETLSMFLETCPVCSTPLRESTEVSCCGGHSTPRENPRDTLVCPECGQRLYTFPAK